MISPRLQDVGLFDFHRADETIDRGHRAVERQLDDILREIETRDTRRVPATASATLNALQPVAK